MTHPVLPKSYRGVFPFSICATSFVYPEGYAANVERLAPFVDEIELLFFEGEEDCLPSSDEMGKLVALSGRFGIAYNVHLPIDLTLTAPDPAVRDRAAQAILRILIRTAPLRPTTHTLHLPFQGDSGSRGDVEQWLRLSRAGLSGLISAGADPASISLETLDYPPAMIERLADEFGLCACVDVGHLWKAGISVEDTVHTLFDRVSILHLHGVDDQGRDHMPLDRLSPSRLDGLLKQLKGFKGTVCVEVFSFDRLEVSLRHLENRFMHFPHP